MKPLIRFTSGVAALLLLVSFLPVYAADQNVVTAAYLDEKIVAQDAIIAHQTSLKEYPPAYMQRRLMTPFAVRSWNGERDGVIAKAKAKKAELLELAK